MANDNLHLKTNAQVVTIIESYIDTAPDGSLRIDDGGLITYLSEQFGYYTASGDSPQNKSGQAVNITNRLKALVNREAWQNDPNWPKVGNNSSEAARGKLIDMQRQLITEAQALEAPYRAISAGLASRAKSLFNSVISPVFPAGEEIILENRTYIQTYVTDRGEESAPSPASTIVELDQNDTATVAVAAAPSGYSITHWRLYRSATGTQSSAFQLQGEYTVGTASTVDSTKQEFLNEACPTIGWLPPPATLAGLAAMDNGILLGFTGRTLHACEPYKPYAWPAKYDKPLMYDIVGIAGAGSFAFVGTTGYPYVVTGSDSESLSEEMIKSPVPCASAKSMAVVENSVLYASPLGLALYENGRVEIVTEALFDRATWQIYQPSTMRSAAFGGVYYAFYTKADTTKGCFVFDYKSKAFGELDQAADAVFANDDGIYILNGTAVLDLAPTSGSLRTGQWDSKSFRLARPQSFGWLHVDAEYPGTVTVRIYADGSLLQTTAVTSKVPVRVKPGKFDDWKVEIEAAIQVNGIALATTTEELKAAL
jgi:hypothetical protein